MKAGIKYILLAGIMFTLFIPLLQITFNLPKNEALSGDYVAEKDLAITWSGWFNKTFQDQKDKYVHDHFGYHNRFVRISNQLGFWLFKKAKANGVVIGKENYLYEYKYIDAYYGSDFIGFDSVKIKMRMIKTITDSLAKMNKQLVLVFAPGKAAYYPEYIPDDYVQAKGVTNIQVFLQQARELNIPHIDFHSWFLSQKASAPYPMIPKYGIHWSNYAALLSMDSVLHYLEKTNNIDLAELVMGKMNIGDAAEPDFDIEKGMNLFFRLSHEQLPMPEYKYEGGKDKPSVLVIADSYYWQFYNMGISNAFSNSDFWYYNKSVHNPAVKPDRMVSDLNLAEEIRNHDIIMVLGTDIALPHFGWGFFESIYALWKNKLPGANDIKNISGFEKKVEDMKNFIRKDQKWMKDIERKAKEQHLPIDSMLTIDARWSVQQNEKK